VISAIIVAAGKGVRMNASTKKQYLCLGGDPIVVRTLRLFSGCPFIDNIYLTVPPEDESFCRELIKNKTQIRTGCRVISGGKTRQESVYLGLLAMENEISPTDLVAIHDGVRPLVTRKQIEACVASAEKNGACILGVPAHDTLKRVEDDSDIIEGTLTRKNIWLAQTPQVFKYELIRNAHERALKDGFTGTDDAMLVERVSFQVRVVPGSRTNLKITTPGDLALAEALASGKDQ
jgi:2-C-methyl-D-erythritol 4-phosphate cytidylyltransferase